MLKQRAIAVPAAAEYNGQKLKAYVVLWAHVKPDGLGYPTLGVVVQNISEVVPESELEQFEGPDLSDAVIKSNTIDIDVMNKKTTKQISTHLTYDGDAEMFPADVRGNEGSYFNSNVSLTKPRVAAWKQFIVEMSSGFDEGHLIIGGPVFSHKLNVEFSGAGIEPVLKELISSVGP